ncbi:MAG: TetR/AcrR family transcriptional regulator [Ruminococcaceae bacterium]|nr:TetR/AcrR family transcriptional regulator [Oscillospiraceae bacterium]
MEGTMENSTKNRILDEALIMFAENGYKGTNLRELAAQLGLSKSALYKHYKSKEDIWNCLLDRMEGYYAQHFGSEANLPLQPKSCEELLTLTVNMLRFTVNDPKIILTRKLLLTEQFHDERVKKLATKHFLEGTQKIFAKVFEGMMTDGLLKKDNPEMLSFIYTAPVTSLVHLCDREPENQEKIFKRIENFVTHFISTYAEK